MAFEDTTAGMSTLNDPSAPPAIGPAAPATTPALLSGGQDQLGAVAPPTNGGGMVPPTGTGVSPSMKDQLAGLISKNSNSLMASSPNPNAPMAWAKSWIAGASNALSGITSSLGDAANIDVKPGGGWLEGVTQSLQHRSERLDKQKEQAAKQKQQDIENQREDKRIQMEQESHDMAIMMNKLAIGKAISTADREQSDELYNSIYAPWAKDEKENKGASLIQEKLTQQGLLDLAKQHESPDDPGGQKWLSKQDVRQDGWQTVTDANGDPIPEKDARGNLTGHNLRKQTFGVYTYGEPSPVTDQLAADAKKYLDKNIPAGTTMDPRDAALLRVQIGKAQVDEASANALALQAGKSKEELAELEGKADYRAAGTAFTPWLIDAKGDAGLALQNMQLHAQEVGPDGKPTPQAQEAAKQYDQVTKGMGPEIIKNAMDTFEKEQIEQIKANAKRAKEGPLDIEGDPELEGDAYIASLPAGRRDIVRQIGNGQAGDLTLSRMASGKDGQQLLAEVTHAYPDFDGSKIAGYKALVKEFNVGKTANQIKAINTALPHLDTLYDSVNKLGLEALPGVSNIAAAAGNKDAAMLQTAKTQAAQELAQIYASGAVTDQEHKEFAKELDVLSPVELKNNIESITDLLRARLDGVKEQWQQGVPSAQYKPPREIVSPAAQGSLDHIKALEEGVKNPPPARAFAQVKEGQQTKFANGQIWTRQNGIPVLVNGQGAQ